MSELVYLAYKSVKKVAVMAYNDKCAVEVLKRLLQHVLGLEIKVIGRLVEDEEVDRLQQQL